MWRGVGEDRIGSYTSPNSKQQIPTSGDVTVTSTKTEGCGNRVNAVNLAAITGLNQLCGQKETQLRLLASGRTSPLSTDGKTAVIFLVAGS